MSQRALVCYHRSVNQTLLALAAARADLPSFAGDSLQQKLLLAYDVATEAVRSVAPKLEVRIAAAEEALKVVDAWQAKNEKELLAVLSNPNAQALPEQIRLTFGAELAQNYLLGCYLLAKAGMAPWLSGRMGDEVAKGNLSAADAMNDAAMRIYVFSCIVKLYDTGYLQKLFYDPASLGAFGLTPAVVVGIAVVVGLVVIASVYLFLSFQAKSLEAQNEVVRKICEKAAAEGDKKTEERCLSIAAANQAALIDKKDPVAASLESLTKVLVVGGLLYAAVVYGPRFMAKRKSASLAEVT